MSTLFQKVVSGHKYSFEQVFYGSELAYRISFDDNGTTTTFRMKKDEDKMWKIQAQKLPNKVHDDSMGLNDAIEDDLTTNP